MSPPARSAKLKLICVEKEQKSANLDTFTIQTSYTCICIACMVCGYSQGGQPASNGGQVPPPPNETLHCVSAYYASLPVMSILGAHIPYYHNYKCMYLLHVTSNKQYLRTKINVTKPRTTCMCIIIHVLTICN